MDSLLRKPLVNQSRDNIPGEVKLDRLCTDEWGTLSLSIVDWVHLELVESSANL